MYSHTTNKSLARWENRSGRLLVAVIDTKLIPDHLQGLVAERTTQRLVERHREFYKAT